MLEEGKDRIHNVTLVQPPLKNGLKAFPDIL